MCESLVFIPPSLRSGKGGLLNHTHTRTRTPSYRKVVD